MMNFYYFEPYVHLFKKFPHEKKGYLKKLYLKVESEVAIRQTTTGPSGAPVEGSTIQ